jgi:hypothetical protein
MRESLIFLPKLVLEDNVINIAEFFSAFTAPFVDIPRFHSLTNTAMRPTPLIPLDS